MVAGGPREVIVEGETGLVTRAKEPKSFAVAVARLIADEELRKSMGDKGRCHVAEKSWRNAFDDFVGDHLTGDLAI